MKNEFSELNDKIEKLEGAFLENLNKIKPLVLDEIKNETENVVLNQVEYSCCGCYVACGSNYHKEKCSCYTACGSNYSRG